MTVCIFPLLLLLVSGRFFQRTEFGRGHIVTFEYQKCFSYWGATPPRPPITTLFTKLTTIPAGHLFLLCVVDCLYFSPYFFFLEDNTLFFLSRTGFRRGHIFTFEYQKCFSFWGAYLVYNINRLFHWSSHQSHLLCQTYYIR